MTEYIVRVDGQMPDAIYERELTEIVRCRDCKRMRDWTAAEKSASYGEAELADGWCVFFRVGTYEDFFCAWGEKVVEE